MAITLVDTDILIDASRKDPQAIACLNNLGLQVMLAISAITQMELIVGCRNNTELAHLANFLLRFQRLNVTESISDQTIRLLEQYRLSHGLLIPDALIAATALVHQCDFITKNQRDFRFISGLRLLPYP